MDRVLPELAAAIRKDVLAVQPPAGAGRPSTKELCQALTTARNIAAKRFGGPVFRRYSGCPDSPGSYSKSGGAFKVLEYLWDFSLSRWAIPQAIEDPRAKTMSNGKFELLLVAESELGTSNEICRDLLKLCEARTRIRCLVYRRPKRTGAQQALEQRMIRVLHNHAHFEADPGLWLFVGVTWEPGQIDCHTSTLNADLDAFIPLP
jgi:hypothetical protein